jgi:hypothetical protein
MYYKSYNSKINNEFKNSLLEQDFNKFKELLNNYSLNPSFDENFPLRYCYQNNLIPFLELLLNHKKIDYMTESKGIFLAIEYGYIDIIILLKKYKMKMSSFKNKFIYEALINNQFDIVEFLMKDFRVDPTEYKSNIITVLAREKVYNTDILNLLTKDIRVNQNHRDLIDAIRIFKNAKQIECALILFKDKNIQEKLREENLYIFESLYKTFMGNKLKDF